MHRRKDTLNPGSVSTIPYSPKTYLERSARQHVKQSHELLQKITAVAGLSHSAALAALGDAQRPAQTQPAQNDSEGHSDSESAYEAAPTDAAPHRFVDAEMTEDPQEDFGSFFNDDLLAVTVNSVLEFGIPWKGMEALQKLIMHVFARHDIPATKYKFKNSVGAEIKAARFHFYCGNCMTLLAETRGDRAERNALRVTCTVCGQHQSGPKM
ncbi:hypothetical protein HPB51_009519 [Rhipicephalus microplus]|uniref:Uncharacterized protein n=1 Tax=Rhipicephalus microplus TaxID=6941 RepID=A0A9J6F151_RHIMP|nr:hypothetical protein HPB51_009519 [Rhipicephalus microplus]